MRGAYSDNPQLVVASDDGRGDTGVRKCFVKDIRVFGSARMVRISITAVANINRVVCNLKP